MMTKSELADDLLMLLIHNKNIHIGDIIFYVTSKDGSYTIHKSRIVERTLEKHDGFRAFFDTYYYHCEDGHTFDTLDLFLPVFGNKTDAVEYVIDQLQRDINGAEVSLRNAQEHLDRLHRSLNVYQKQLEQQ